MAIKNRLKIILAQKNIPQSKLVEDLGINKSTISNIILGRQNATLEQAINICDYLGEKIENVFYKEKNYESNPEINTDFNYLIKQINQTHILHENNIVSEQQLENLYVDFEKNFLNKHGYEILNHLLLQYYNDENEEINEIAFKALESTQNDDIPF